jgi:uncharacterized protein (DUF1697 family)
VARYVALLYSIVLPGRRITAGDLIRLADAVGLSSPKPLLASGNLLFETQEQSVAALEEKLDAAFLGLYGKSVPIIVRPAEAWRQLAAKNPFPEASARDGSLVGVRVQRDRLGSEKLDLLAPYRCPDESVEIVDGDLWVRFPVQMPGRRLLTALTPRRLGIGTLRNWNTVRRIAETLVG